jgi:hypothetical protein
MNNSSKCFQISSPFDKTFEISLITEIDNLLFTFNHELVKMGFAGTTCSSRNYNAESKIKELEENFYQSSEYFKKQRIKEFVMDCFRNIPKKESEIYNDDDDRDEEETTDNILESVTKEVNGFYDAEKNTQVKLTPAISSETIRPMNELSIKNNGLHEDNFKKQFECLSEKSVNEQQVNGIKHDNLLSDSILHENLIKNFESTDEKSIKSNNEIEHESSNETDNFSETSKENLNADNDVSNIEDQLIVNEQINSIDQLVFVKENKVETLAVEKFDSDESKNDTFGDGYISKEIKQISESYSYSLTRIKKVCFVFKSNCSFTFTPLKSKSNY